MRGEYSWPTFAVNSYPGSPPHARGILRISVRNINKPGITPACAGNTLLHRFPALFHGDHPRMRGEYTEAQYIKLGATGSPPHARGIRVLLSPANQTLGITPACAGNTPSTFRKPHQNRDHPRMRGEYPPQKRLNL